MARTRVRLVVSLAFAVAIAAGPGRAALGGDRVPFGETAGRRHVVRSGDTLWEIARGVVGPEGDPRPVVDRLREANGLEPADPLLPGMALVVPSS